MEKVKTYLPIIGGLLVAVVLFVFFLLKKKKNNQVDKSEILEKAREAKLAKSILRKSENEESPSDNGE
jgi:LPXTG-motif cell wall-anchored protein